jgi:hypothetical protein
LPLGDRLLGWHYLWAVARFRLRFLLQELDLVGPDVVLGRSPDCQITIDDPLVSRQHARIVIEAGSARVVDLGSRNGVRVNGNLIRGEATLKHNDRVRLGTQDLVFLVVEENQPRIARSTGYMMHCEACGRPFPGESAVCPHCGHTVEATSPGSYETITGLVVDSQTSWTFQLLGEVIERALAAGRAPEAERMFQRAAQDVSDRLARKQPIDPKHLSSLAVYAMRLSQLLSDVRWGGWVLDIYIQSKLLPANEVLDQVEALRGELKATLKPRLEQLLRASAADTTPGEPDDDSRRQRISQLL